MPVDTTVNSFFGVFFTIYQTQKIWGNFLSTKYLEPVGNVTAKTYSDVRLHACGSAYCNEDLDALDILSLNHTGNATGNIAVSSNVTKGQLNKLIGIYLAMSLFASLLVIIALDRIPKSSSDESQPKKSFKLLLGATMKLLRHKTYPLLIPLSMFRGMQEAFYVAEITKAFVTCPLGVQNVGLIAICFGVSASVFAFIFGFLIKWITRVPIFLFAGAANFTAIAIMLYVHPSPDKIWIICIVVVLWGIGDACYVSQVSALFGILFSTDLEGAFASSRLYESIGFIMGYSWSSTLCMWSKLWIAFGLLCTAMLCYLIAEIITYITNKKNAQGNTYNSSL